jgi:protein-disulfide isomerase
MPFTRRTLLSVAALGAAAPAFPADVDTRETERSIGAIAAGKTVLECFSLTCPHCAAFAKDTLPVLKARWIETGRVRWVFRDFPGDMAALQGAMVARYLPEESYEAFIDTLFASQDRWVFAADSVPADELWRIANHAGMSRATFEAAVADTQLRAWIVRQAMDLQTRFHVDATPSFVVNDKAYVGAMSADEFGTILASQ